MTAAVAALPTKRRKSLEPFIFDSVEYYSWQIDGIRDGCRRPSFILADEMGLGKSIEAITIFAVDVVLGKALTAIVVAPATLKVNWADELDKFTRMQYVILGQKLNSSGKLVTLNPGQRQDQIREFMQIDGVKILIANYEQIKPHLPLLNACKFDMGIFDEAHYMKNHKAERTKACLALKAKRNLLLTGSPMLNQVDELWTLLHKIDPRRFPKYWPFVMRYAVFGGYKDKQIIGVKNQSELNQVLSQYMIRRLAKDHLGLDEPHIIPRIVELHPEQRKLYDQVVDDMRLTVDDDETVDIENALVKFLKLKQICGTTAAILGPEKDYSYKLDLVIADDMDLIRAGEKVVIFTQFLAVQAAYIKRMTEALYSAKIDCPMYQLNGSTPMHNRVPTVKAWADVDGPAVIVCMLQVAGVGLNMVAAHHAALIDKLFVPKLNEQAIARLQRLGQKYPVQIRDYKVKGTIETRIEQILRTKAGLFKHVIEKSDYKKLLALAMKAAEEDE